jgi:hypothetical protein
MTNVIKFSISFIIGAMLAFGTLTLVGAVEALPVFAQQGVGVGSGGSGTLQTGDFLPTEFTGATGLGGETDLQVTIANLIRTVISFLGIVAVVIVLYGGFKWMTASGSDEKVAEAKKILIAGLIGLAIVLTALAITNFAIGSILRATI